MFSGCLVAFQWLQYFNISSILLDYTTSQLLVYSAAFPARLFTVLYNVYQYQQRVTNFEYKKYSIQLIISDFSRTPRISPHFSLVAVSSRTSEPFPRRFVASTRAFRCIHQSVPSTPPERSLICRAATRSQVSSSSTSTLCDASGCSNRNEYFLVLVCSGRRG